jgi:hypothetical protein
MTELLNSANAIPQFWIFVWLIGWLLVSLAFRKARGKPIFYRKPKAPIFRQWNASGNYERNFLTKFGGAHNCLVVQVAENELDIHPFVPFNWLFLPEIYGLEFRIPLTRIKAAKIVKKLLWTKVELEFKTSEGENEKISLWLKNPEEFIRAINITPKSAAGLD